MYNNVIHMEKSESSSTNLPQYPVSQRTSEKVKIMYLEKRLSKCEYRMEI